MDEINSSITLTDEIQDQDAPDSAQQQAATNTALANVTLSTTSENIIDNELELFGQSGGNLDADEDTDLDDSKSAKDESTTAVKDTINNQNSSVRKTLTPRKRKPRARRQIRLTYQPGVVYKTRDQLISFHEIEHEGHEFHAGDLLWVKFSKYPWWPCMITVDPGTGKYSRVDDVGGIIQPNYHVQYFGEPSYRGYTCGQLRAFDSRSAYEEELENIRTTPTTTNAARVERARKLSLLDIRSQHRKQWKLAATEADEAAELLPEERIKKLTFEYVVIGAPKRLNEDGTIELTSPKVTIPKKGKTLKIGEKRSVGRPRKLPSSSENLKLGKSLEKLKLAPFNLSSVSSSANQSGKRKRGRPSLKKQRQSASGTGDVYDFNEFDEELDDTTPTKPLVLSSAKRAKGDFSVYARQSRDQMRMDNPQCDEDEITNLLQKKWDLMPDDLKNVYVKRTYEPATSVGDGSPSLTHQKSPSSADSPKLSLYFSEDEFNMDEWSSKFDNETSYKATKTPMASPVAETPGKRRRGRPVGSSKRKLLYTPQQTPSPTKRGPGRPPGSTSKSSASVTQAAATENENVRTGRVGRPANSAKHVQVVSSDGENIAQEKLEATPSPVKRGRGRPPRSASQLSAPKTPVREGEKRGPGRPPRSASQPSTPLVSPIKEQEEHSPDNSEPGNQQAVAQLSPLPANQIEKRRPGRPVGSGKKRIPEQQPESQNCEHVNFAQHLSLSPVEKKRGPGRPPSAKKKIRIIPTPSPLKEGEKRRPGRPFGSVKRKQLNESINPDSSSLAMRTRASKAIWPAAQENMETDASSKSSNAAAPAANDGEFETVNENNEMAVKPLSPTRKTLSSAKMQPPAKKSSASESNGAAEEDIENTMNNNAGRNGHQQSDGRKRSLSSLTGTTDSNSVSSESAGSSVSDQAQASNKVAIKQDSHCGKCYKLANDSAEALLMCSGTCRQYFHSDCLIKVQTNPEDVDAPPALICEECHTGVRKCFVCKQSINTSSSMQDEPERLMRCSQKKCTKVYHLACLSRGHYPYKQISKDDVRCPLHTCLTCHNAHDDDNVFRNINKKLVTCIRCPTAYHNMHSCVPAGASIINRTLVICPEHIGSKPSRGMRDHINVTWCFSCNIWGDLLCCERCPTAFHRNCIEYPLPDGKFTCLNCIKRKQLLYNDIAWVKVGAYRWWPAKIKNPNEVPKNIRQQMPGTGYFPVFFFGSHDYCWVSKGRAFQYVEGDNKRTVHGNGSLDNVFKLAMEEVVQEYNLWNVAKKKDLLRKTHKPPPYYSIKVNKPYSKWFQQVLHEDRLSRCDCNADDPCNNDIECVNRVLMYECDPKICVYKNCKNQRFKKREYAKVIPFKSETGWGLKAKEDIFRGHFVIEYVGELIDEAECGRRLKVMAEQNDTNFYFLTIDKDTIIDAGPKGNLARFMNHSCDPNCETQKWIVNQQMRIGLFALHDIPSGTELTFNYNLDSRGSEKIKCLCGSTNCSGYIGLRPNKPVPAAAIESSKKSKLSAKKAKNHKRSKSALASLHLR